MREVKREIREVEMVVARCDLCGAELTPRWKRICRVCHESTRLGAAWKAESLGEAISPLSEERKREIGDAIELLRDYPFDDLAVGVILWWRRIARDLWGEVQRLERARPESIKPLLPSSTPIAYMCPEGCGCLWRNNNDGTMSLFGENSKSCRGCESLPLDKLNPLYAFVDQSCQLAKWKHRAHLFRDAYEEKSAENTALTIQKLDLESLGDEAMRVQRDRARGNAKGLVSRFRDRAEAAERRVAELEAKRHDE